MLELIINRIKLVRKIDKKIIATTTNLNDDKLVKCVNLKNKFYRGSEHNVLNRVYLAVKNIN